MESGDRCVEIGNWERLVDHNPSERERFFPVDLQLAGHPRGHQEPLHQA